MNNSRHKRNVKEEKKILDYYEDHKVFEDLGRQFPHFHNLCANPLGGLSFGALKAWLDRRLQVEANFQKHTLGRVHKIPL